MHGLLALLLAASPVATDQALRSAAATAAPRPCATDDAGSFDFWLGYWTANVWTRKFGEHAAFQRSGLLRSEVTAELDGCLIVEKVELQSLKKAENSLQVGYSARFFDQATGLWRAVLLWPSPGRSRPYEMIGGFRHGRAEFFRTVRRPAASPLLARFTFSDIAYDSVRWDSAVASETWSPIDFENNLASTWFTESKFEFKRVSRLAKPLQQTAACQENNLGGMNMLPGLWQSSNTARSVEISIVAGGCALEFRFESEGRAHTYALLAYDTQQEGWQAFVFSPGYLRLQKLGSVAGDTLDLSPGASSTLTLKFPDANKPLSLLAGGSWTTLLRVPSL